MLSPCGDIVKLGDIKARSTTAKVGTDLAQTSNKLIMSVKISPEDATRLLQETAPLIKARAMADKIRDMQELWVTKIKYMDRRQRRVYTRQFRTYVAQFKAYCTKNGINYNIQNSNDERN